MKFHRAECHAKLNHFVQITIRREHKLLVIQFEIDNAKRAVYRSLFYTRSPVSLSTFQLKKI